MALTDESGNGMVMPVAPMYGGGNGGFGNSWGGDGWWILILFFLLAGNGGWGMNGFGGGMNYDFPWLFNGQNNINANTNAGFRDAMLNDGINGIRDGINGISTQLCNGFAGVNQSVSNGFAQAEIAENARQMANMQQMFSLQSQFADCCCENRLGTADLKYTIASENCADRAALSDGIRDILAATTAQNQRILDQLCADKIDAKNDTIAQLRSELMYARGQASQDVQTLRILAGQTAETDAIYNRLNECPIGTVPVYGRQPIFSCNNNGCGCGCGNSAF